MKKVLLLLTTFTALCTLAFAQTQLPNGGFESWSGSGDNEIPDGWHTFNQAQCDLSGFGSNTACNQGKKNHHEKSSTVKHSGSFSCMIKPRDVVIAMANGNMTTGQIRIGSTSADDPANYNYSNISSGYAQSFTGYPDALRFWASFYATSSSTEAKLRAIIHSNYAMHDPVNDNSKVVADMTKEFTRTTSSSNSPYWTSFTTNFDYDSYADHNQTPAYILITFTTNKIPGEGNANDRLYMDDIEMIYLGKMNDIKVGGNTIPGFSPNTLDYTVCYSGAVPSVTATAASKVTRDRNLLNITQTAASNGYTVTINRPGSDTTYTIHLVQSPTVNISPSSTSVCQDGTVTLSASGSQASYSWSHNLGASATVNVPTSTPGTTQYTVTATANGCTATATATVTVKQQPTVTVNGSTSGTASICSGASTTLNAVANPSNATLTWSGGSVTTNPLTVNSAGTYTVTANLNGCTATSTVTVTAHNNPTVSITGPSSFCLGTEETLTASGASNYSWSWNTDHGTETASGSTLTITEGHTYSVTGTDGNGCTGTATLNVTGNITPTVSISGATSVCSGSSTTLTAEYSLGASLTWTGGGTQNNNKLTVNASGHYTATASLNGCTSSASVDVSVADSPEPPIASSTSRCGSGRVTLTASAQEGETCYWYSNNSTGDTLATGNTFLTPALTSTTTYYVSAKNEGGCFSTRVSVNAVIDTLPKAPTVTNISKCGESDITLTATASNPVRWFASLTSEDTISRNQHVTEPTDFYAAAFDGTCYSNRTKLTVTVNEIPAVPTVTSPEPYCSNDNISVTLTATPANGCIVKWYDRDMQAAGQNSPTKIVNESTTFYATSYNSSTKCESATQPFNIVINSIPAAPTLSCEPRCGAGEVTLNANGQTATWYNANGQSLGEGATYTTNVNLGNTVFKATVTSLGCESAMASVTAVAKPDYHDVHDYQTACDSYTWEGDTYTESGMHTKTLTSSLECDSTVTLHLTILTIAPQTFDTVVCDQFEWEGEVFTSSGYITKNLHSQNDCDSTVNYNLTVLHSSSVTKSLTLCHNQLPYPYAGTTITSGGTKIITIPNAENCDSIITLNVTVLDPVGTPKNNSSSLERCGSGSINLSISKGSNSDGCNWYYSQSDTEPFQTGYSYQPNLSENTTYYVTSYNSFGCESARLPITVTINPVPAEPQVSSASRCGTGSITLTATADDNATTCRWYLYATENAQVQHSGFSYTRNFNANTTTNLYVESYNSNTQCKSSRVQVTATAYSIPAAPQVTSDEHCGPLTADLTNYVTTSTDLLRWYNSNEELLSENAHYTPTISESTTYLVSNYNNETTCESAKTPLTITIHPNYSPVSLYDTVCQFSPYKKYNLNETFDTVGEFPFELNRYSSSHCDSLVTLYIYVKPVITNSISEVACDTYTWNGETYDTTGEYVQTFTAANGCDSVVTLFLTIHQSVATEFDAAQCVSYTWNDETYTKTGDYTQTFSSAENCDSTVTLHLTIYPAYNTGFTMSACEEYVWNNTVYQTSGDHVQSFETVHGCDSTVTMHLTIHEPVVLNLEDEICAGENYTRFGFDTTFTQANIYHLTHFGQTIHGCDSTTNLVLTVHPAYNQNIQKMICENSSYTFNGQTLTEPDIYTAELQTIHGCDSIVTLNLTIGSQFRDTITDHICAGASYHKHGFHIDEPTESLYDSLLLIASNNCDSMSVLHLIVHYPDTAHLYATLCQNDSYRQHGFNVTFNEAGDTTLVRHTTTPYECDSVIMVHITVNPKSVVTLYDTVCAETPYAENGFEGYYEEAGNHTLVNHAPNQYLCDSTTTLYLTVLPSYHPTVNQIACKSYTWNDTTYYESGVYTQRLQSIHGCDSIVTMNLTILQPDTTILADTVCGMLVWNNVTYNESGTYTQQLQNIHQCDSIVILNLEILPTSSSSFDTTVCASFTWNDSTYTESGIHVQHFENVHGCDSTVTVYLTVYPTHHIQLNDVVCLGHPYSNYGFDTTITEVGTITLTHNDLNIYGCDSTTTLTLKVNPTSVVEHEATVCQGTAFNQYGFDTTFTEAGVYTLVHNGLNIHDCDSTTTVTLTVLPTYSIDTTVSICDNLMPFLWDNNELFTYFEAGNHDLNFTTVAGCDSIIHLHLIVNPTYVFHDTVTVCQGALPYYFDEGHSFDHTGNYPIDLASVNGCDSTWNLHLIVTPNDTNRYVRTICDSQLPYTFLGDTIYTAGLHEIIESDNDNCLTINQLTLNVNPTYHGYDTITVCEEELPIYYGDSTLLATGDYDIHFNSVLSCDSLISVHFTVIPTAHGIEEMYVCASDFPVDYGDTDFTQEGVYSVTFHRDGLCDSIVTLTLHRASEYLITDTVEVCDHELPYFWHDTAYYQTGVYYDSLVSMHGCDSVYRLDLTVNETQVITSNPYVMCQGESVIWRGMTLTESGIYRDTTTSTTTGCREIYEISVTFNPTYHFYDTVTICDNELPYIWHGTEYNTPGLHDKYHQTLNDCDSIHSLRLIVNPTAHHDETVTVCDYDLPYIWHGDTLTESNTYYDTLTTANGCDSTFTLVFNVNPSEHVVAYDTVCDTQLPISWRGYTIEAAGIYYDTTSNAAGCNDFYELQLTVNHSDTTTIYDTICKGGYYSQYGFDTLASQAGTLYDQIILSNANSCDSIVNLVLRVLPTYLSETNAETCENVPFQWHGGEFVAAGTYYDSLTTVNGCDSVFILHLSLNPTFDTYISDSAMNGHEYQHDIFVITPSDSGTWNYDIQYYTVAGCDSIVHLTLYVAYNDGIDEFSMTPEFAFFPNPTQAALNITGERMKRIHVYDLSGKLVLIADPDTPEQARIYVNGFATGHYVVRVTLDDGNSISGKIIVDKR